MRGLVPQFLLQPLVENAFEHGIGRRAAAGTITLRILRLPTGRLRLEVRDDGEAPLAALVREHVGLGNSRRRLAHLYGDDQSFTLTAVPGGGAMAAVELPYHES
jgi:sensor histidine kinase YesM